MYLNKFFFIWFPNWTGRSVYLFFRTCFSYLIILPSSKFNWFNWFLLIWNIINEILSQKYFVVLVAKWWYLIHWKKVHKTIKKGTIALEILLISMVLEWCTTRHVGKLHEASRYQKVGIFKIFNCKFSRSSKTSDYLNQWI